MLTSAMIRMAALAVAAFVNKDYPISARVEATLSDARRFEKYISSGN